jgi:hypothetical protein
MRRLAIATVALLSSGCALMQRPEGPGLTRQEQREYACARVWIPSSDTAYEDWSKRILGYGIDGDGYRECVRFLEARERSKAESAGDHASGKPRSSQSDGTRCRN